MTTAPPTPAQQYLHESVQWEVNFRESIDYDAHQAWDSQTYATMYAFMSIAASLLEITTKLENGSCELAALYDVISDTRAINPYP